jgi:hypothetical protein
MPFQIKALPKTIFARLFELSDRELASANAVRVKATQKPGFPCRVSLADAEIGEDLILTHFEHHTVDTPFRSSHAVYVRRDAVEAKPVPGTVPDLLRSRMLSLRAFDSAGMMVAADLADGAALENAIEKALENPSAAYLHLHFAKPGCYAARVDRV